MGTLSLSKDAGSQVWRGRRRAQNIISVQFPLPVHSGHLSPSRNDAGSGGGGGTVDSSDGGGGDSEGEKHERFRRWQWEQRSHKRMQTYKSSAEKELNRLRPRVRDQQPRF